MTVLVVLTFAAVLTVIATWYAVMTVVHCWFAVLWGSEDTLAYRLLASVFPIQAAEMGGEFEDFPTRSAERIAKLFHRSYPMGMVFCLLGVLLLLLPSLLLLWWATLTLVT